MSSPSRHALAPDLWAGLSVAGLILPEAVAYAGIANQPAVAGIAAACIGLIVFALLGASPVAMVAATSSSAVVIAAAVHAVQIDTPLPASELIAALIVLAGVVFVLCGALRLGRAAHFIARPVVRGLAFGLACVIVVRQVVTVTGVAGAHSNFVPMTWDILQAASHWNWLGIIACALALAILWLLHRWPAIPGPLVVIVLGISAHRALAWVAALPSVGAIHLAQLEPRLPELSGNQWARLAELSIALALILFAESYSSIRALALRRNEPVNLNRDLVAMGLANLICGAVHSMPVGAGYSATNANDAAGARSRKSGFVACIAVAIAALAGADYVAMIPHAVLAAIIIYAMRHALALGPLRYYFLRQRDRLMVTVSVAAVLLLGVLDGLLAAVAFSLIMLVRGISQPRLTQLGQLGGSHDYLSIDTHPQAQPVSGMLILRPEEPLFFANVSEVLERALTELRAASQANALILSLEESPDLDGTAVEALEQFAMRVAADGKRLVLARLKDRANSVLQHASLPHCTITTESVAAAVSLARTP